MRIGYFGGTFDPPHLGHLAVADASLHECSLDRLIMAPTGRQPLKKTGPYASFEDRVAMVGLLCQSYPQLEVSAIDAPQPDGAPNYTVDTLAQLRRKLGSDAQIFSVTGADAFLDLRRWREPERLLAEAEWIVVSRPGVTLDLAPLALTASQRASVHVLDNVHVPVSATEIRERLRDGASVASLMPEAVLAYISAHHLYEP